MDVNNSKPLNSALVSLIKNNEVISEAKTDNFGEASVFVNLFDSTKASSEINLSEYKIVIDGIQMNQAILPFSSGVNVYNVQKNSSVENKIELAFIVDATGSMGDELEFLKNDLTNVINRVKDDNVNTSILTSALFYRDYGDDYATKHSDFSSKISTTANFIKEQQASGGGDYEEAVEIALDETISNMQWSHNAKSKIAFLLLDAPPHHNEQINESIEKSLKLAAKKGIKLIPITVSGINKSTEFLMRYFAVSTNGTYVFITNDSGIGNEHIEPTVGEYQVEFLNDLLVRIINKYAK